MCLIEEIQGRAVLMGNKSTKPRQDKTKSKDEYLLYDTRLLIVFGFIRYKGNNNTPIELMNLIVSYVGLTYEWMNASPYYEYDNSNKYKVYRTDHLPESFSKVKYCTIFSIDDILPNDSETFKIRFHKKRGDIMVGIIQSAYVKANKNIFCPWAYDYGYGYHSWGMKWHNSKYEDYGKPWITNGIVINISIDMSNGNNTLKFGKENELYHIAYSIKRAKYKIFVSVINGNGNTFEMIRKKVQ
eukprot:464027_1